MNQSASPAMIPPRSGLDKEEPEQAYEEDIPSDGADPAAESNVPVPNEGEPGGLRHVERE
jgi:hypothetical protein